jgi:hypothetical protein
MHAPVQARTGHTAFPNELLARALAELTPEQFRLLAGLYYEAEYKRNGTTTPDGRWRVRFGQVLVSYASLAKRYGISVHAVERALHRFGALGVDARRATPATPPETPGENSPATPPATPPTIVDFGNWSAFLGSAPEAATPPATPAETPTATPAEIIQHRNTETPNTEKPSPSAPARRLGAKRVNGKSDPRHHPLQQRLEATYLELRGTAYGFQGGRDARGVTELLRLADGDALEVVRRWRRALELGERWPGCASISVLASRWNELAGHARGGSAPARAGAAPEPSAITPAWARAREHLRSCTNTPDVFATLILPLRDRMVGERLVLTAPNEWHVETLQDQYGEIIRKAAGCEVLIQVEHERAAGGP